MILDRVPSWFVALPDCAAAEPIATALRGRASREARHPSGRTWLLGRWDEAEAAVGARGDTAIAVIGEHALTAAVLAGHAATARTLADLDAPARSWPGNFHLIASVAGRVRIQAPLSGYRRVVRTRVGGVTVAANRADVLAELTGAALDEARLAVALLEPCAPHPIGGEPMWRGVTAVPAGYYLAIDGSGWHRRVRWWRAPEPNVPMAQGAAAFRAALAAAVEVRTRGRELISTDLSGFDTTSLCCLAARGPVQVAAYTWEPPDPAADDVYWARKTVARWAPSPSSTTSCRRNAPRSPSPASASTTKSRWTSRAPSASTAGGWSSPGGPRTADLGFTSPVSAAIRCSAAPRRTCTPCCAGNPAPRCATCVATPR